jgi:hypothetical protein
MDPAKLAKLQAAAAANRIGEPFTMYTRDLSWLITNLLFSLKLRWKGNCAPKNCAEN